MGCVWGAGVLVCWGVCGVLGCWGAGVVHVRNSKPTRP